MDSAGPALRARDRRVADRVGREARLELNFERVDGRTIVTHAYAEPPFRVGRCLALGDAAYVIVVCAGPGVFAGDTLRQAIHVGRGARAVLTSQSALQVHPSAAASAAVLDHRYTLDTDAELHCHWDPVIPFADARLEQRFDLRMPSDARLLWSDAIMAGRVTRGEAWRFRDLAHEIRLEIDGRLQYLERYRIASADRDINRRWMAGEAGYIGTTLVHHARASSESVQAMHAALAAIDGAHAAVDLVEPRLLVARTMTAHGIPFAGARAAARRLALETIFESPHLAGRKSV